MNLSKLMVLVLTVTSGCFAGESDLYRSLFEGKNILITGGTGFIGRALIEGILPYNPKKIVILSRDEVKHYNVLQMFKSDKLVSVLGDVRDYDIVEQASRGIDLLIHAAALKRLDLIESNIFESVRTNIIGTENVVRACVANNIPKAIFVSSDKACSPANAYGACKYVSEKIFTNSNDQSIKTQFVVVRYGNVLESTGSVIPFFCDKIKKNQTIPLTDDRMTRFFISKEQAVELIFKAIYYGTGGEIFIPSLPAFKIVDLISVLCERLGNNPGSTVVGLRPGEKIHELMINYTEIPRTYKFKDIFVITPTTGLKAVDSIYIEEGTLLTEADMYEYSSGDSVLNTDVLNGLLDQFNIQSLK